MNFEMKFSYILKNFAFLKNLIYYNKGYNHLKKLLKSAKRNEIINKIIVFNTVKSFREYIDREFFIGKILALNGANVIMFLDDGLLKSWQEDFNKRNSKMYVFFYKRLIRKALRIYRDKNLRIIYYSEILDENKVMFKEVLRRGVTYVLERSNPAELRRLIPEKSNEILKYE